MKKESALPQIGAVYSMYIEELKRYGAYQILQSNSSGICYIVLDYLEEVPPNLEGVVSFQPFYLERFRFHHQLDIHWVSNTKVPRDYLFIGIYPLVVEKISNCLSGEWGDGREYIYEMEWNMADSEQKAAYKKFCNSKEMVRVGKQYFKKNLNGMRTELYQIIGKGFPISLFPCLTFVEVKGTQEGLIECLEYATLVHTLRWKMPQIEILDLRKTSIRYLEMDADGVREIYLPEHIKKVELYGKIDQSLRIYGESETDNLFLSVAWQPDGIGTYGLKYIKKLRIFDIKEQDLMEILPLFLQITSLSLQGHPGILKGLEGLQILSELQELEIQELFGYTANDLRILKQFSKLRHLTLFSIPKEVGTVVQKNWKEQLDMIEIKRLRSDEWIKENVENPFRSWDGREGMIVDVFKKAFEQYKKTRRAFIRAVSREAIVLAIQEYATRFNRLQDRYMGVIRMEEKKDIFAALEQIYWETEEGKGWIEIGEVRALLESRRKGW